MVEQWYRKPEVASSSLATGSTRLATLARGLRPHSRVSCHSALRPDDLSRSGSNESEVEGQQFRPHFNSPKFPEVRDEKIKEKAKDFSEPVYAIDDETAISVVDSKIDIVSEGEWKKYN